MTYKCAYCGQDIDFGKLSKAEKKMFKDCPEGVICTSCMSDGTTDSKIFTQCEYKALMRRLSGGKLDKTGIYSKRVKPKIKELIHVWFKKKKKLEMLLVTESNRPR